MNIDFFSDVEHFYPGIAPLVYFYCFILKKNNTKNIDDFSLLIQKKNYSKIKVFCKQNRHFYRDFFEGFQIFLTSSLYRSMWTIGQASVLREEKYRPIVRKIRYLVFVGEFKKNVTRQTWRALFHFGEYFFQSTRHFGECLKKMIFHTVMVYTHLINSMVTQHLLPIGYFYENRLHSSTEI